ncbi:MAG: glycosyltransferase family 39 protein, partial [Acidobacteria bacterium]|nr:glycosyltransferase family 39 protein [Acidobacteriota bacterium]
MSRAVFGCLVATALVLAPAFRLAGLDLRPMHHDEANQAVKFGMLLETGEYKYDRNDHHGPTLYYLTLPSAWIRGQTTLASLDERTLRVVPAIFGAGLILLLSLLAGALGRTAVAASALLTALSPALTYYSRFYIQESLFVFFALGFLIALGRCLQRPGAGWAISAGIAAGLAYATKETSVIVLPAVVAAAALAWIWTGPARSADPRSRALGIGAATRQGALAAGVAARGGYVALGLLGALLVALLLYSSFFRYP